MDGELISGWISQKQKKRNTILNHFVLTFIFAGILMENHKIKKKGKYETNENFCVKKELQS